MDLATNLEGRLRNTRLPSSSGLLPLYEAVANAIHAIEDAGLPSKRGKIRVEILRSPQKSLALTDGAGRPGPEPKSEIDGFVISDNGVGFTRANMESFLTLDSSFKAARGGRGVGRLLWLKAFSRVRVESVYVEEERLRRTFTFDAKQSVSDHVPEPTEAPRGTQVHLLGFVKRFRAPSPKTLPAIARHLLEHCLWYFVRPGGAPKIVIQDGSDKVSLDELFEENMRSKAETETLEIKGQEFDLLHVRLTMTMNRAPSIVLCASRRVVMQEPLRGKIPGLFGPLGDADGEFVYECYVSSPFLDERVHAERTSFDIEDEPLDLFAAEDLSLAEIRGAVIERASAFLSDFLRESQERGLNRVEAFVSTSAPRYRPILSRIPKERLAVDPEISDKDLELHLHKNLVEIERRMLADGHDLLAPAPHDDPATYNARLKHYLKTVEDVKKSDLAGYVSHRRVIIDLLEMAIRKKPDGKYVREDLIHNLIMPMRTDSTEVRPEGLNLWLVDERLAFHDYLASDKTLASMPITGATDGIEPDVVALKVWDNPVLVSEGQQLPLASITVVELKRPMRNDAAAGREKDPIEQALDYLDRIRTGKVQTSTGRQIPNSENIPGYCYVICDLTPTIQKRVRLVYDAIPTSDGLGYFFFHTALRAYIEIISFDGLLNSAKERNRAFFDKLGLPTK